VALHYHQMFVYTPCLSLKLIPALLGKVSPLQNANSDTAFDIAH
jgi:hypothetical protein